ncbi:putative deleted in lung and esophageal cancer protein [Plasmopara halstedii]
MRILKRRKLMTGASKSKAASTSDYEIDQTAKTLDLDAVADDIALQMHHEECERLEKFQEQNEPNHVAVGATAHVIRRAFHTFYDKPEIRDQAIQVLSEIQQTGNNDDLNEQEVKEESPFVAQAQARKQAIALKFERKHERANSLLQFMELRQQEAAEADAQFAQNLSDQGLVLKAQIPIGPTNLRLNDHELQLAQDKGSDFGEFVESLLYAKTFMVEYEEKRQHLSGNQEKLVKRTGKESQKEEYMGYLNTTTSFNIRTEATLEHHKHDIADIKAAHAVQRATAASAHLLKANIHGQLQSMNPVEKRKNRAILKRMQSKLNFVRNPRYSIQDVSKMTRHNLAKGNEKNPPCFAVAPKPPILFSTYDIGGMYEQIVYVRNVSVLSRCARILSPSTMFFTLTSIKFPTDRNQVAPGMHIEVCIRFTPNSRADFTDSFSVQYETMQSETQGSSNSSTMIVPLVASRESPELTLPLVIQAQNTLVGGRSVKSLKCKNLGGKAKFWILTEFAYSQLHHRELENSTVDTVVKMLENGNMLDATMKIGPFSLQPTAFELAKGQSVILELIYIPSESHEQRENFVMVCDNCLVKVFELVGRGCQVEVVATKINHVQIDTSIPNMGLLDRMVFKDEVIVNASAQQSLEIMNKTPLDVKYFWHIHSLYNENKDQTNVVSHESKWMPPFCINPKTGVFEMLSTNKFTIGFSPTEACTYACQAILMINDISACSISKSNLIDHLDSTATEVENAMPVFSIQLHGRGKHGSFTIIPAFINSWTLFRDKSPDSGSQSVHILNSKQNYLSTVQLINQCNARIAFCWDITQTRQRHLTMHDSSLSTLRWLLLEGRVAGAEIEILTREIDFGPVLVGTGAESVITIRNPSRTVTTDWKFVQLGLTPENESGINHLTQSSPGPKLRRSNSKDSVISRRSSTSFVSGNDTERSLFTSRTSQPRAIVTFAPDAGVLAPGELFTLKAICMAGSFPERFRGLFRCQTAPERTFTGNKISHAAVSSRAEVQCAEVFLSTSHLTLGIIYLGVEIHRSFELVNASNLETAFKFVEPEGTSRAYTVSFVPKEGIIHSKARLAVTLHYTPRQTGRFSVIFACSVRGMSGPLGLEVSSSHKGLVLSYSLVQAPLPSDYRAKESTSAIKLPESPKEIALKRKISLSDCDLEPQVNSVPKLAFGDCNYSGIEALLTLEAKRFPAAATSSTLVLKNNENLNRAQQTSFKMISLNFLSYHPKPMPILAFQMPKKMNIAINHPVDVISSSTIVQILCFNNMPGTYVDDIICRATGALPIILHTHVNVVARLVWKLVESGSEDQEVRVTLRVDFASKLHLQITPCDHDSQAILPFTIEPKTAMVPAFSLVPFRITFQPPSNTLGPSRIVLLADAHWYDPKNEDTKHSDTNINQMRRCLMSLLRKILN